MVKKFTPPAIKKGSRGRVAFMLESSQMSGGVRVIYEMALGLTTKGWDVHYFSLQDSPDWFNIVGNWHKYPDYPHMQEDLHTFDGATVATWWRTAYVLAAAQPRLPFYLVQDIESAYYSTVLQRQFAEETYKLPLKKFTTSKWVQTQLDGVAYVGIGIRKERFQGGLRPPVKRRVAAVARPQAIKGFSYLLELSSRLQAELSMPLVTFGQSEIHLLGMHEHFVQPSDRKVQGIYTGSRYFVTTSQHEGFGLPNLEAMASGSVVITTDCQGPREYMQDWKNGIVVSTEDPREVISAIRRCESDESLRKRMIMGGANTVELYKWPAVIERLDALLHSGNRTSK